MNRLGDAGARLLHEVRQRLLGRFIFERLVIVLAAAAAAWLAHLLLHKWLFLAWPSALTFAASCLIAALLIAWSSRRRLPGARDAAFLLDRALAAKDRFQTAWESSALPADHPAVAHLLAETETLAHAHAARRVAPFTLPHGWFAPLLLLAIGFAVMRFVPEPVAPLRMTSAQRAEVVAAAKALLTAAEEMRRQAPSDTELRKTADELANAAARLRSAASEKDRALAELEAARRLLAARQEALTAAGNEAAAKLAGALERTGFAREAEALKRGEWQAGMEALAGKLGNEGLANRAAAEELAKACEAAAASAGEAASDLRTAAEALRRGDGKTAAAALARAAAGNNAANRAALAQLANRLGACQSSVIANFPLNAALFSPDSFPPGTRFGSESGMPKYFVTDSRAQFRPCSGACRPGETAALVAVPTPAGAMPGAGAGCSNPGPLPGTGTSLGEAHGGEAGQGAPNINRPDGAAAPKTGYYAYQQLYGGRLAQAGNREERASAQWQPNQPIGELQDLGPQRTPPVAAGGVIALSGAELAEYREAAGAALQVEEIPDARREYVREYFDRIVTGRTQ